MRTMLIIGCTACGKRAEFYGEYAQIQKDVSKAGWREWNRKTGSALCLECVQRNDGDTDTGSPTQP